MQIGSFDAFASIRSTVVAYLFGKIARTIGTKMRRADGSDGGLSRINIAMLDSPGNRESMSNTLVADAFWNFQTSSSLPFRFDCRSSKMFSAGKHLDGPSFHVIRPSVVHSNEKRFVRVNSGKNNKHLATGSVRTSSQRCNDTASVFKFHVPLYKTAKKEENRRREYVKTSQTWCAKKSIGARNSLCYRNS